MKLSPKKTDEPHIRLSKRNLIKGGIALAGAHILNKFGVEDAQAKKFNWKYKSGIEAFDNVVNPAILDAVIEMKNGNELEMWKILDLANGYTSYTRINSKTPTFSPEYHFLRQKYGHPMTIIEINKVIEPVNSPLASFVMGLGEYWWGNFKEAEIEFLGSAFEVISYNANDAKHLGLEYDPSLNSKGNSKFAVSQYQKLNNESKAKTLTHIVNRAKALKDNNKDFFDPNNSWNKQVLLNWTALFYVLTLQKDKKRRTEMLLANRNLEVPSRDMIGYNIRKGGNIFS